VNAQDPPTEVIDYERGWEGCKRTAVAAIVDLRSKKIFKTVAWEALTDAMNLVSTLEPPKAGPNG
jgi:hypothetical protein